MQVELRLLQRRLGITTVMVTHDQDEALTLSDRIVVMRNGRVEQVGSPDEVYQRPITRFVAGFLGMSNFFHGMVERRAGGPVQIRCAQGMDLTLPATVSPSGSATIALRPEAVRVSPAASIPTGISPGPNAVIAILEQTVYRGFMVHYHMRLPDGAPLIAFRQNTGNLFGAELQPGHPVLAEWDAAANQVVRDN